MLSLIPVKRTFAINPCSYADRFSLHYLLMNAIASRPVSGSFQLPLTETSPTRRLVLRALEAGDAYLRSRMPFPLQIFFWNKKNSPTPKRRGRIADKKSDSIPV